MMFRSYTFAQIRAADEKKILEGTPSLQLMQSAAIGLAAVVLTVMETRKIDEVLFVCGGGNNGGDGFAAAQLVLDYGKRSSVLCLSKKFSPDCAEMKGRYKGEILGVMPRRRYALIVDCVLGTGLSRAPEGDAAALVEFINQSGAYVIACDLPSGLSDSGLAFKPCVRADKTVTIGGFKNALILLDGADMAGEVSVADIGLSLEGGAEVWSSGDVANYYPKRKSNSHKGSYGSACIFAADTRYSGAVFLATGACLKSGVGYTRLTAAEPLFTQATGKLPAAVLSKFETIDGEMLASDCIALGMGAGVSDRLYAHISELLQRYTGTLVLDADALNTLARYGVEILKEKACRVVLTPHPKEFARLTGKSVVEVLENAVGLAKNFAEEYGVTVILKSNRSVITDGERVAINPTGSTCLAKGGSGDVLTGLLAGTVARGVPLFEAVAISAFVLGRAGELAEREMGEYSPDASDIVNYLSKAILSVKA